MGKIGLIVLKTIAGAGILAVGLCAPNALRAFGMFDQRRRKPVAINKVAERLRRQGYLRIVRQGKRACYELTEKGRRYLSRFELRELRIPIQKTWDKQYRLIIFDIAEKRKHVRDEIRAWLRKLGCIKLQQSVWVFPYPCRKIVALLKTEYKVEKDVLYVTAAGIEHDEWLRKAFGLE